MKNNTVEEIAEKIYNAFPYDEVGVKPLWQPGGNSNMQERARLLARDIIQHHQDQLRELNKAYMNYTDAILQKASILQYSTLYAILK